ncbi:MAG: sugar ABC transporter permease, partial [Gammaproteobacteria bacterium]
MSARHAAWLFATPALAVIGVFFFLPVLAALFVSLTDFDLYALADIRNLRFVGLGNYWRLLHAPEFWRAVGNTLYFVLLGVPLSLAASLTAALLISSRLTLAPAFF